MLCPIIKFSANPNLVLVVVSVPLIILYKDDGKKNEKVDIKGFFKNILNSPK